jgi:hypothetical protein
LKVIPAAARNPYVSLGHLGRRFSEYVKENDELLVAAIQNTVVYAAVVTSDFAQRAIYLAAVGKRKMRVRLVQVVDAIDLAVQGKLMLKRQVCDELLDGLSTAAVAVIRRSQTTWNR